LTTEARLQKSVKAFTDNVPAVKAWRDVGKGLGLTPEDLDEIDGPTTSDKEPARSKQTDQQQLREYAGKMLSKWMEISGENASIEQLLGVVKKLKLNNVTGKSSVYTYKL